MNGILNINKPRAWTSHDVVAKLRGLLKIKRIGHTGTLDPEATGVLLVCIGKATRVAEYLVARDKHYQTTLRLGITTDTQDATGKILAQSSVQNFTDLELKATIKKFTGDIAQIPPMYSAVKINGTALHKLARNGHTIPRPARSVHVDHIGIKKICGTDVLLDITCSKGTYIRTLCNDIGDMLGCGGHMLTLTRQRVGQFLLNNSLSIEDVEQLHHERKLEAALHRTDDALHDFPAIDVVEPTVTRVRHGAGIRAEEVTAVRGSGNSGMLVRVRELRRGLLALGRLSYPIGELGQPGDTRMAVSIEKVLI